MRKKRILLYVCILIFSVFTLSGCKKEKGYSYDVGTGDTINIKIDKSTGLQFIDKRDAFEIRNKKDEVLFTGVFLDEKTYNEYSNPELYKLSKVIEDGEIDENPFLIYEFNDNGKLIHDYVLKVKDSKTGIFLYGTKHGKELRDAFDMLTFSKAKK